ncbi:DNA cytosine methyltransferase [Nocardioides sp. J54]|uniref:DNA cytosine methyltransferase n=1 Tax=Nocardioides sp. J54 TaxID=935866 RepID=UPI0004B64220|nr:DNA cytosine methyltransferase [Nocardioides sp. J54]
MSGPRIGELFAGYGGLGMGVQSVYGGEVVWVSEFDKGPSKILAHRFPHAPNLGDITKIKWTPDCPTCGELLALYWNDDMPEGRGYYCPTDGWFDLDLWMSEPNVPEPVDILTGGSPCQDLSHAGRRAGMTEGTRSNLWVAMREAIAQLRPAMVVWENVGGAFSAAADSEVEPCAGCVGDGPGVHLRALGRVLGDLASLGYDASWHSLRAADVGAPHGRLRVFVVATDANGGVELAGRARADQRTVAHGDGRGAAAALLPTPRSSDTNGAGSHGSGGLDLRTTVRLLPTATTRDHKDHTIRREPHRPDDVDTLARALTDVPCALLPTPRATDGTKGGPNQRGSSGDLMLPAAVQPDRLLPTPRTKNNENRQSEKFAGEDGNFYGLLHNPERWGDYAAAIARWEHVLGRTAPEPTTRDWERFERRKARRILSPLPIGMRGSIAFMHQGPAPQLSPRFVEFLMGLPAGWITDVPGITRNEALKALGNGVVPQQAAEALRVMAGWAVAA